MTTSPSSFLLVALVGAAALAVGAEGGGPQQEEAMAIFVNKGEGLDSTVSLGSGANRVTLHAINNQFQITANGKQVLSMTPLERDTAAFTPEVLGKFAIDQIQAGSIYADDFEIVNPDAPLQQWLTVHADAFTNGTSGWTAESGPELETSTCGGVTMIGGPCKTSHHVMSKTFELPKHAQVQVTARVHFIDNWDDDTLWMKLSTSSGEATMWQEEYTWCPQFFTMMCAKGYSICGQDQFPDRVSRLVHVSLDHQEPTLSVRFGTNIPEVVGPCQVSYGVSDVVVEVR